MESSNTIPVSDPTSAKERIAASSGGGGNSTALDQWRGLALVFVLISHGFYFTGRVHGIGRVGVNLFFFISGVLVFRSLTSHRDATAWGADSWILETARAEIVPGVDCVCFGDDSDSVCVKECAARHNSLNVL